MANEETNDSPPKNNKKLLILIGLAVLVIGGGAGGAVVMMGGDKPEETPHEEPTVGEEIVADATGHGEDSPGSGHGDSGGPGSEAGPGDDAGHGDSQGGGDADGHGGGAAPAEEKPITTTYRFANPFVVNILDNTGRRYLNLIIEVETTTPEAIYEIEDNEAPLRDALIMLLSSKSMDELSRVEGKIKLKQEIILRMESVLGPGKIKNVYFIEFNMLLL